MDRLSATAAGLSVLAGLAGAGVALAQGFESSPAVQAAAAVPEQAPSTRQAEGRPAGALVEPVGAAIELTVKLGENGSVKSLLIRSGAANGDSAAAAQLIEEAVPAGLAAEAEVRVLLGSGKHGARRLEQVSVEAGSTYRLIVGRDHDDRLRLVREALAVDASPQRLQGKVGTSLFWSLRAAGASAETARDYVNALSTRIDPARDLRPGDEFELVVDHMRTAGGKSAVGPLLYAGLRRPGGRHLHLVRWTVAGGTDWFEPGSARQKLSGFEQPVRGAVSSRFGHRVHPILRIGRFHSGVDYRAGWGTPVVAAADGIVTGAGSNGGYGRQVRLAHSGGVVTSYSHLSRIAAEAGAQVRRGEVIGYVGSTGFSTGPHLHYEVRQNGRPVDPLSFRHSTVTSIGTSDLTALRARLEQLRSI